MKKLAGNQVEAPLDTIDPELKPIKASVHTSQAFCDARDADLKIGQIFDDAIDLFVDPPQVNQHDIIGLSGHGSRNVSVPLLFRKESL